MAVARRFPFDIVQIQNSSTVEIGNIDSVEPSQLKFIAINQSNQIVSVQGIVHTTI